MEYISDESYKYLIKKYRDLDDNSKIMQRFVRNDALFSEDSGTAPAEIMDGILKQDAEISDQPHPIRKAKAFEYVILNTRISCDTRDRFPAINMIDRPLNSTLVGKWNREVFGSIIPEVSKKRSFYESNGISTMWPDFDHSVPHWDRLFELGFCGILTASEEARSAIADITPEQEAFYDGIKITYTAIIEFLARLEKQAITDGAPRLAKSLKNLQTHAPGTFYEALLLDYIYFMLSEHIEGLQVRSLSNFDRLFFKYYKHDLESGITEQTIREDLAYFFMQFTAIGNYWNQPVYLGGCKEDESTQINELSYLFLDVYDKMGIYNPKIQIKVVDSTPREFLNKSLDMIRRGNNCIVFVSDKTIRVALENVGISKDDARLCDVKGCYEYSIQGSMGTGMNYVNLLKPMEYALHKGYDGVKDVLAGLDCRDAGEYADFDEFFTEYKRQLGNIIANVIATVNIYEDYLDYINPQSMLSATYPTCIESGRDALGGGAASNNCCIMFGFMADAADSLAMIKKHVFDRKELTLSELRDILDKNYEGHEKLRRTLLADRDKYGNNKDLPDGMAKEIVDYVCSCVCGKPNAKRRGGRWNLGFHVARMSYAMKDTTASSPNGRLKGEELSKNMSASMGMNREGATAAILSVTKIDATKFTSDSCLDLGLLPSAVKGEDGLEAMYALLMTFIKRGGHAMHINVFDADTLRKAQKEPEKYQDLQIRVCGWNVLFNNINKEEQDGFIKQAENLI